MTKKLMLFIVLLISLLSIIIIAVWGTLPENSNSTQVESISFNEYELNDDLDKILNVMGLVTIDKPNYTLSYSYLPEDAEANIKAISSSTDVTVIVDANKEEVIVSFSSEAAIGQNVTIRIIDQKTNQYDEITLIFKIPDIIIED